MAEPYVVAGCPIKNRAWVVDRHIDSLAAQTIAPKALAYLLNDDDGSTREALLGAFPIILKYQTPTHYIEELYVEDAPASDDVGHSRIEPRYSISNLARVRNAWLEAVLKKFPEATHLWSCDSDVLPEKDVLETLLATDSDIVAAVVRNSTAPVWNFMCGEDPNGLQRRNGMEAKVIQWSMDAPVPESKGGVVPVTLTGACILIRREVIEAGVRYAYSDIGEDAPFCIQARARGFQPMVAIFARTAHAQPDGADWKSHLPLAWNKPTKEEP